MAVIIASLIVVSVVSLLNLALCMGIIRRLREHTELLEKRPAAHEEEQGVLAAGSAVGAFSAGTTAGETISEADLDREAIVAFFSPGCQPCQSALPEFIDYARGLPEDTKVMAVVVGNKADGEQMVERLTPAITVITDTQAPSMVSAFSVRGYPAFYHIKADSTVATSGHSMSNLPQLATV